MRHSALILASLGFTVTACGPKAMELSADPVERAATCAVVAAANARATSAAEGALPFAAQVNVIQYPMLAGASQAEFSREQASAVIQRMQAIQEDVTGGDWKSLVVPCQQAYPDQDPAKAVNLPADTYKAQIGCYSLANFVTTAMKGDSSQYENELVEYGQLQTKLDGKISAGMVQRGITSDAAKKVERDKALTDAVKWGAAGKVIDACQTKFGDSA